LRKYLIVAIAALTAVAFTTVALAQTGAPATLKVTVKPKKAGTKKKPKNSSIELNITNNDPKRTLGKLTITSPKTFVLSAKGLPKCSEATLESSGPSACPAKSRAGTGTASALVGVNSTTTAPTPLTFDVTAFVLGPKKLGFYLAARELPINVLSPGTIKGRKLTITVPDAAQQPATGVWAGLKSIHTTLKLKKGKHYLAATKGCKKHKHAFTTVLHFVNNTVSPAGDVTVKGSSKCS
jgi:hypothetical protein